MASGIYRIYGPNGKFYIGSATNLKKRKSHHFWSLAENRHVNIHLQRAYNLYGPEAFSFSIVEIVENVLDLIEVEQRYIDNAFDTCPERLYNFCKTAGSSLGRRASDEARKKMSERRKGRMVSNESRSRISKGLRETFAKRREQGIVRVAHNRGSNHSEETRKKMSETAKRRGMTDLQKEHLSQIISSNVGRQASEDHRKKIAESNRRRANAPKRPRYSFMGPDGTLYEGISNLAEFGRAHGMSKGAVCSLVKGRVRKTRTGWALYTET